MCVSCLIFLQVVAAAKRHKGVEVERAKVSPNGTCEGPALSQLIGVSTAVPQPSGTIIQHPLLWDMFRPSRYKEISDQIIHIQRDARRLLGAHTFLRETDSKQHDMFTKRWR